MNKIYSLKSLLFLFLSAFLSNTVYADWTHMEAPFKWYYNDSIPSEELKKRAEQKDGVSMNDYANALMSYNYEKNHFDKAKKWYDKATKQNVPKALLWSLSSPNPGLGKEKRMQYAEKIFSSGEVDCIYKVANYFIWGIPYATPILNGEEWTRWDNANYLRFLKRASELGYKPALYDMALIYCFGGVPLRNNKSKQYYLYSLDIVPDIPKAFEFFKNAIDLDNLQDKERFDALFDFLRLGLVSDKEDDEFMKLYDPTRSMNIYKTLHDFDHSFLPAGSRYAIGLYANQRYDEAFPLLLTVADEIERLEKEGNNKYYFLSPIKIYQMLSNSYRFGRGCGIDENLADKYLEKSSHFENNDEKTIINSILNIIN
ncbi:MAG: hypothetical protein K2N05_02730 [Muribaculaceae bacterium]|nr:hypothetical protein [Muribaculaceae bacterium]